MAEPPTPLNADDRVGCYRIRHELGRGATAWVYAAEHERLGRPVAIKVLRPDADTGEALRRRFERELDAMAAVRSRHVPGVHDTGELDDGLPYLVMERLHGRTLCQRMACDPEEGGAPMSIALATELGIQLAAALAAVHAAGVVHRDVKPGNLVLHRESDGRRVLELVDFGICTPVGEGAPKVTLPGKTVGTPEYMSPEQARGLPLDGRSDVFSAGSVLYEMIAGRCPFRGTSPDATARAVARKEPPLLTELRPDCPEPLARIVERALAKRVDDRFASAAALRDALLDFAETHRLRRAPSAEALAPSGRPRLELHPEADDEAGGRDDDGEVNVWALHEAPGEGAPGEPEAASPRADDDEAAPAAHVPDPARPLWRRVAAVAIVVAGMGWGTYEAIGRQLLGWDGERAQTTSAYADEAPSDATHASSAPSVDRLEVLTRAQRDPGEVRGLTAPSGTDRDLPMSERGALDAAETGHLGAGRRPAGATGDDLGASGDPASGPTGGDLGASGGPASGPTGDGEHATTRSPASATGGDASADGDAADEDGGAVARARRRARRRAARTTVTTSGRASADSETPAEGEPAARSADGSEPTSTSASDDDGVDLRSVTRRMEEGIELPSPDAPSPVPEPSGDRAEAGGADRRLPPSPYAAPDDETPPSNPF
ncbi:MAG TPA: protein kinase [Sandaracinaceae bacterium LLY-WYZ-13_1]|nr:protein kinase [Sandaracinaceae bacterium LLY-WYZ-13_1]